MHSCEVQTIEILKKFQKFKQKLKFIKFELHNYCRPILL